MSATGNNSDVDLFLVLDGSTPYRRMTPAEFMKIYGSEFSLDTASNVRLLEGEIRRLDAGIRFIESEPREDVDKAMAKAQEKLRISRGLQHKPRRSKKAPRQW